MLTQHPPNYVLQVTPEALSVRYRGNVSGVAGCRQSYVAMRLFVGMIFCLMLTGCDKAFEFLAKNFGDRGEVAILISEEEQVGVTPLAYVLPEPLPIEGGSFAVCLVLEGDVELEAMNASRQRLDRLTSGAKITVSSKLTNGESEQASGALVSWSRYGNVVRRNEFSGCVAVPCAHYTDQGLALVAVTICADKAFTAKGIYAEQRPPSINDWQNAT